MTESMASNSRHSERGGGRAASPQRRAPEWADGLKQLYDSVVEEALPGSFQDLLDQLDTVDPEHDKHAEAPSPGTPANER
jgi:Anti-sigma factor NepR